ncbi:TPA: hypothetical protein L9K67_005336, partial [Klebsiella pneumoniae]|nr:hypothetical protein [Klebsiella pneumoniae]
DKILSLINDAIDSLTALHTATGLHTEALSQLSDESLKAADSLTGLNAAQGLLVEILAQVSDVIDNPDRSDSLTGINSGLQRLLCAVAEIQSDVSALQSGSAISSSGYRDTPLAFELAQVIINIFLSYGQSLSAGAHAETVLSLTQPYNNITYASGVRGTGNVYNGTKPLVENDGSGGEPDGSVNEKESPCAGMANYASLKLFTENNIQPADHVIFAGCPGHTGWSIKDLN